MERKQNCPIISSAAPHEEHIRWVIGDIAALSISLLSAFLLFTLGIRNDDSITIRPSGIHLNLIRKLLGQFTLDRLDLVSNGKDSCGEISCKSSIEDHYMSKILFGRVLIRPKSHRFSASFTRAEQTEKLQTSRHRFTFEETKETSMAINGLDVFLQIKRRRLNGGITMEWFYWME